MNFPRLTASLLVLSLFALPVLAEDQAPAAEPVQLAKAAETPAEVQTFLQDKRPASELSDEELKQRFRQARGFIKGGNLANDVRRSLQEMARAARIELQSRAQGGGKQQSQNTSKDQKSGDQAQTDQSGSAQVAANTSAGSQVPADVQAFLQDSRPASALSDDELRQRFRKARGFMKAQGLSAGTRRSLQDMARQARLEIASRTQSGSKQQTGQTTGDQDQTAKNQKVIPIGTQIPADVLALIKDPRQPSELTDAEIKSRLQAGGNYLRTGTSR